ncbi:phosphoenolpyruvate carboxykinase [Secundilactobacillus paracollinoides]|uniref:phosphoenolpyruvate carboxykinase (ATP) n=1 Tax=Secundilactobacillus paracollinoides TaxID=240427 RepID=UPI00081A66D9|nr:phosphoenolpyruvate carboxykinase (ATP) [Secundilactobacillus paracollinoides]ANZ64331.1 phosphoenolpyruvate carboxykinase [Secundilactobacillus paracollinoides]
MTEPQNVETAALYMNPARDVAVIDYSSKYMSDIFTLINSKELFEVVRLYLEQLSHHEADSDNEFEDTDPKTYLDTVKAVLLDREDAYDKFNRYEILDSIENLYSYYRSFLRIGVLNLHGNEASANTFMQLDDQFNSLVIRSYRTIEEKLQGFKNKTYRQVSAGTSAVVLTQSHDWPIPKGYESLKPIRFLDTLSLRPPMMMTTPSNKREGTFTAVPDNPIDKFHGDRKEWYCFPAKIGESLCYIYFHRDYFVSGISLANLFEVADAKEVAGHKPDEILLFGIDKTEGDVCHYHHDEENDIWVGEVPYNDKTTYFGYMKKMCLTLHNLHMIYENRLPIHGSMVRIKFANGKNKNVVFFGDSGAGKSESLEALQEIADDKIISLETIFDDMGSFAFDADGNMYAQGTEIGAFVRLDDLSEAVAFNNMDRGVYLNPDRKNARVIIPADSYRRVVKHHQVDMWVYANNYDTEIGIHQFDNEEDAKDTFITGKRFALGTTDEVGMSTTFFANPFGPVQEEEKTRPVIDKVFNHLFKQGTYVGEIYTHLGTDKSKDSLNESAQELLDVLWNS